MIYTPSPLENAAGFSLHSTDFGKDFKWGVSVAAYQVEGGHNVDNKGPSIWDVFTNKRGNIYQNHHGNIACNFYHGYRDDLQLMRSLHIPNFRFSLAWSRIMPTGRPPVNQ